MCIASVTIRPETKDHTNRGIIYAPRHEKTCLYHMRITKAQISAFVVRFVDSMII